MHSHRLYFSSTILVAWTFSCMDFMHKGYFSYKASTNQLWPATDPCISTDRPNRLIRNPKSARNSKSKIRNPKFRNSEILEIRKCTKTSKTCVRARTSKKRPRHSYTQCSPSHHDHSMLPTL